MEFSEAKNKYFIIVEGSERAIIRESEGQAEKVKKRLSRYSNGKKIYVYKANLKNG